MRLLELRERGFRPVATVADAGPALRAGQKEALPGTPCRGDVFHAQAELTLLVRVAVRALRRSVVRASSVVEDLNGRLRGYFFLRRHLGGGYLQLLQFFLNHRRFMRSEQPERVGQSPRELMEGEAHGHWLEMLGHRPFKRAG